MKALLSVALILIIVTGCVSVQPLKSDVQKLFTYDYQILGQSQNELWKRARDYMATQFGDSRSVIRVMDEKDGTILGKGMITWPLVGTARCPSEYHFRFAAKEAKARLQLEIINGVPAYSDCVGWPLPSESGYTHVVSSFNAIAKDLENSLNGKGATTNLKDF